MGDIIFFLTFLRWFVNIGLLLIGLLVILGTVAAIPWGYRHYRSWILRRRWRLDQPRIASPLLTPRWDEYDPEVSGVARRCICHHRRIHPGENVLLWPESGPMGLLHVAVYCDTVKEPS